MEKQKNFKKFEEFIKQFDIIVNNNYFHVLHKLFPKIDTFEEKFLNGYHKRKSDGTFYTNKTISDFIVIQTLVCIINKRLNENTKNGTVIKNLDDILKLKLTLKQKIIETLLNITICDPACGSGGFLLSAGEIIYDTILKSNCQMSNIQVKNKILTNLYGFDINEYSIKLCRLKLLRWYNNQDTNHIKKLLLKLKSNVRTQNSIFDSNLPKFDIIIGNPPYGNILNQNEKEALRKENVFYKDIYCTFLLKALNWSNEVIGLLVPKSFLLRQGYIKFRNDFLSKANIIKIFDIGSKIFKRATNEVQIIIYENKTKYFKRDLTIYDYPKTKIISYQNQKVDSLNVCFNPRCPLCLKSKKLFVYSFAKKCPYCNSNTIELNRIRIKPNNEIYQLIEKIEINGDLNYLNPVDFPKMIRGEEEIGLKTVKSKIRPNLSGSCFFISARKDFNYFIFHKGRSFNIEELDPQILKGNEFEYYQNPKLLIKHNNIIPEAIYSEECVCFTSSIYSLLHNDTSELKYLCAIFNSALIQFYCIYAINNQKDTTINLNQYMIRHLPIIKPDNKIKNKVVERVDKIDKILQADGNPNLENFHQVLREIDNIIFSLYSLRENEVNLILSSICNQIKHFEIIYK
ncbi:MAG: Eco57I restriction-modification methylase domain-containing protein [Promethearchaeota archaeon]